MTGTPNSASTAVRRWSRSSPRKAAGRLRTATTWGTGAMSSPMRFCAYSHWFLIVALGCGGSGVPSQTPENPPLRVGTIGDPPPFSIATDEGYSGIDLELAEDLAQFLGRPLTIKQTTWRTLLADANADHFDVAMSGINVTDERSVALDFTRPYAEGARVAVVRCTDADRFQTLEDIDQPDVTVVAQVGTSTCDIVREHLPNAQLREAETLEEAALELLAGQGDVIMDTVYRRTQHSALCATLGGRTFFPTSIAFAVPKGSPLLETVDQWLARRLEDGTVETLLRHYGFPDSPEATWVEDETSAAAH